MEANGKWRGRDWYSLPPMSLSAPSCNAGVYARCWLKTLETGGERHFTRTVGRESSY